MRDCFISCYAYPKSKIMKYFGFRVLMENVEKIITNANTSLSFNVLHQIMNSSYLCYLVAKHFTKNTNLHNFLTSDDFNKIFHSIQRKTLIKT